MNATTGEADCAAVQPYPAEVLYEMDTAGSLNEFSATTHDCRVRRWSAGRHGSAAVTAGSEAAAVARQGVNSLPQSSYTKSHEDCKQSASQIGDPSSSASRCKRTMRAANKTCQQQDVVFKGSTAAQRLSFTAHHPRSTRCTNSCHTVQLLLADDLASPDRITHGECGGDDKQRARIHAYQLQD